MTGRVQEGTTATAKVTLKITPVLRWYGYGPGDLPPAGKIYIAQQAGGSTQVMPWIVTPYGGVPGSATFSPTYSNPLGGIPVKRETSGDQTSSIKLIQRDNTSRKTEISLDELTISTPSGTGTSTTAASGAGYKARLDTRSVAIGRVDARGPIKQKGAPGVTIDEAKDEWVDVDGTGHGHTTYSYNYEAILAPAIMRSYHNWQNFTAAAGGWSSSATGTWSLNQADDTKTQYKIDMDFGKPELAQVGFDTSGQWRGDPTDPKKKTITYTITDNGTTATANYKLMQHDEWETGDQIGTTVEQQVVDRWQPFPAWYSNPYNTQNNPGVMSKKYGVSYDASVSQEFKTKKEVGSKLGVDAGVDGGALVPALKKKGITLGATGEAHIAVASESTTQQANSQKMTYSIEPPVDINPGEEALPLIEVLAKRQKFKVFHFGESGFLSESEVTVDTAGDAPFRPTWERRRIQGAGGQPPATGG